jgi:hypothetical protein
MARCRPRACRVLWTALRVAGVVRLRFGDARKTNDEILHLERSASGAASFGSCGKQRKGGDAEKPGGLRAGARGWSSHGQREFVRGRSGCGGRFRGAGSLRSCWRVVGGGLLGLRLRLIYQTVRQIYDTRKCPESPRTRTPGRLETTSANDARGELQDEYRPERGETLAEVKERFRSAWPGLF